MKQQTSLTFKNSLTLFTLIQMTAWLTQCNELQLTYMLAARKSGYTFWRICRVESSQGGLCNRFWVNYIEKGYTFHPEMIRPCKSSEMCNHFSLQLTCKLPAIHCIGWGWGVDRNTNNMCKKKVCWRPSPHLTMSHSLDDIMIISWRKKTWSLYDIITMRPQHFLVVGVVKILYYQLVTHALPYIYYQNQIQLINPMQT